MLIENGKIGQINIFNINQTLYLNSAIHFIFNLRGNIYVTLADNKFYLKKNDLVVIPVNESSQITCTEHHSMYMDISIQRQFLKYFNYDDLVITCTPLEMKEKKYHELIYLLQELYKVFFNKNFDEVNKIILELLITLRSGFAKKIYDNDKRSLKKSIKQYLQQNFTENISLETVANDLRITPQYLSSYFKSNFNQTFLKYINNLRLAKSTQLLKDNDLKIINVAFECGFNSVSTYNRLFKSKYKHTPVEWKKLYGNKKEIIPKNINEDITKLAQNVKSKKLIRIEPNENNIFANKIIASYIDLNNIDISNEFQDFQKLKLSTLFFKFEYKKPNLHNYIRQIEKKISKFINNNVNIVVQINLEKENDQQKIVSSLKILFKYFANLISIDNIKKWGICFSNIGQISEQELTSLCQKVQKDLINEFHIVGNIIYAGNYSELYALHNLSLSSNLCFLLRIEVKKTNIETFQFYLNNLKNKFSCPIFLSNLLTFTNQYSILNDTEIRANLFLKIIFKNFRNIDGIVIGKMVDNKMGTKVLIGDNGIETKSWLPKPIFHAISFLNSQGKFLLDYDSDHVITWNGENDYSALLINPIKIAYYQFKLTYENYLQIIEGESKNYLLVFKNLKPGKYKIKIRKLSSQTGNIVNGYQKIGFLNTLSSDEYNYLKNYVQPELRISVSKVNNSFKLPCCVGKGEIVYIHLIYLY